MDKRRGKRHIADILQPYIITAIVAASVMVIFTIIWVFAGGRLHRSINQDQTADNNVSISQTADQSTGEEGGTILTDTISVSPAAEDGSGRAGIMNASEDMLAVSGAVGLYSNNIGSWYAPKEGCCYYNGWVTLDGNRYHFNSSGYMDTGWTAIGGAGCYFDENGIYDPNADASMLIALTFDDGPSEYTSAVLDILEKYNVQATFMMLGTQVEKYGDVIPRMAALGNTIGNHSYDHQNLLEKSADEIYTEFAMTDERLAAYGVTSSVVRFPYGEYTKDGVAATGKPQIFWDVDSLDWESRDAGTIVNEIYSELQGGCIVLMHDIYQSTLEAVDVLIPDMLAKGYKLVNIEELAASRGYTLNAGTTYFSFKQRNVNEGRVTDE